MVKAGDKVTQEQGLITLETDKAAMDVPAPFAGTVKSVKLKKGDKVSEGSLVLTMDADESAAVKPAAQPKAVAPAAPVKEAPKPAQQQAPASMRMQAASLPPINEAG